jgi:enoyl-CoA hydratase
VESLLVERKQGYAIITLNDPDHRNVFSLAMSAKTEAALDELEADESINAVILTGAGKGFCAGGHLDELLDNPGADGLRKIYTGFLRIANSRLATIAAVNGAAVGAGMNLALACDLIVASETARFDSRFLQIGIGPGGGHAWRLRHRTDLQTVNAMVLFSEVLDGTRAAQVGLAWKCVPPDDLLPAAEELAARAGSVPRELLIRSKQEIRRSLEVTDSETAVDYELETQAWSMEQPAFKEKVAALLSRIRTRDEESTK